MTDDRVSEDVLFELLVVTCGREADIRPLIVEHTRTLALLKWQIYWPTAPLLT